MDVINLNATLRSLEGHIDIVAQASLVYQHWKCHVKRLDEDLNNFAEDLKQEGKVAPDKRVILPPLPIAPVSENRKSFYGTPQAKRLDYRDREFELMPPPGSHRKEFAAPVDVDQPIDPNEPTYGVCHQVLTSVSVLFCSYSI
ncbi:hypothetical protein CIPAW_13G158100 [Carya illinoinensis]|uniref:Uncharacterized protein n=1 Tax=Carya illinoinensis TaxID=32201 RepID=A0A8T1NQY5_CARIL|nr:hypothetical protein CIPAW_13G158100 [Carya illinoinensis]